MPDSRKAGVGRRVIAAVVAVVLVCAGVVAVVTFHRQLAREADAPQAVVWSVALKSDLSAEDVSSRARAVLVPALQKVPGVDGVQLAGDTRPEIAVTIDQAKADKAGVDQTLLAGYLWSGANTTGGGAGLGSADDVKAVLLPGASESVTLSSIAAVEQRDVVDSVGRLGGQPAVILTVTKAAGADSQAVAADARQTLDSLLASSGVSYDTVYSPDDLDRTVLISQTLPATSTLEAANTAAAKLEAVLGEAAVERYQTTSGAVSPVVAGVEADGGSLVLESLAVLKGGNDPAQAATRWQEALGAGYTVTAPSAQRQASVEIVSSDPAQTGEAVKAALAAVGGVSGVENAHSDLPASSVELRVEADDAAAAADGYTSATLTEVVQRATTGQRVSVVQSGGESVDVVLRNSKTAASLDELADLELPVTQRQTLAARAAAAKKVAKNADELVDDSKKQQTKNYNNQLATLRNARATAVDAEGFLTNELNRQKARLGDLQVALAQAQQAAALGQATGTSQLSSAVYSMSQVVKSLDQGVGSARSQVTAMDEQISALEASRKSASKSLDEQAKLAQALKKAASAAATPVKLSALGKVSAVTVDGAAPVGGKVTVSATVTGDRNTALSALETAVAGATLPAGASARVVGVATLPAEVASLTNLAVVALLVLICLPLLVWLLVWWLRRRRASQEAAAGAAQPAHDAGAGRDAVAGQRSGVAARSASSTASARASEPAVTDTAGAGLAVGAAGPVAGGGSTRIADAKSARGATSDAQSGQVGAAGAGLAAAAAIADSSKTPTGAAVAEASSTDAAKVTSGTTPGETVAKAPLAAAVEGAKTLTTPSPTPGEASNKPKTPSPALAPAPKPVPAASAVQTAAATPTATPAQKPAPTRQPVATTRTSQTATPTPMAPSESKPTPTATPVPPEARPAEATAQAPTATPAQKPAPTAKPPAAAPPSDAASAAGPATTGPKPAPTAKPPAAAGPGKAAPPIATATTEPKTSSQAPAPAYKPVTAAQPGEVAPPPVSAASGAQPASTAKPVPATAPGETTRPIATAASAATKPEQP
ncbi:MAG: efflux RND transporter permease subunit, partial [Propionibacteriaceae bacterium]|nr:efflux RND transporter permease subunit [Propionibacteriaceae bacterium]